MFLFVTENFNPCLGLYILPSHQSANSAERNMIHCPVSLDMSISADQVIGMDFAR
jgi:hypothetical protein